LAPCLPITPLNRKRRPPWASLVLIRHGQANSAANDEDGYDRLSDLGHQQARWLGDWLRAHEAPSTAS
jgi:phosphohistidine phosphatase SixA